MKLLGRIGLIIVGVAFGLALTFAFSLFITAVHPSIQESIAEGDVTLTEAIMINWVIGLVLGILMVIVLIFEIRKSGRIA